MNNDKGDCVYHPGELEVYDGDDFWADHDEDCHGVIDTEEMRKMFPEGFMWDCCEVKGDEPGCKESRHRPSRFFP
ncbi:uncharacterized protein K452DRAFT_283800 [Aplosporella prunicola CBS 121167]|uniref:EF-hand domain-containing protein n=1 Tax=Aplosporella prunicola CBS 121167 TaxID=1176127 RepID=A0A6A6BMV2_9PEZI|nr:uncharacterized protein K452DRAFT_283800 [Aplosporella prunicola CBS 121167]KAF2145450.1 hypothetical protein K452DRAFT_283800 [Aplosporella prunicola CBS 121167]